MERFLAKDQHYKKVLKVIKIIYILTSIGLTVGGFIHHNVFEILTSLSTLLLFPALYLVRRWTGWQGGYQLETYIYLFTYLSWTLGGVAAFYTLLPGYDKLVHCLSGVFVSLLALTFYRLLERRHSREGENPATVCFFVFFASMAVAALFELGEFTMAPLVGRDFQHVLETGVGDTMGDIFVCMLGTLVVVALMVRSCHGRHDFFTDAAEAFALQNPPREKQPVRH